MSTDNVALAHRVHSDLFQDGHLDAVNSLFSPGFVIHSPNLPDEMTHGPEGIQRFAGMIQSAFSNIRISPEDTVAAGDKVVDRWTFRGTHNGEFMGLPATGKSVAVTGIDIFRIADGKIAEMWQNWDQVGMMTQLGGA